MRSANSPETYWAAVNSAGIARVSGTSGRQDGGHRQQNEPILDAHMEIHTEITSRKDVNGRFHAAGFSRGTAA